MGAKGLTFPTIHAPTWAQLVCVTGQGSLPPFYSQGGGGCPRSQEVTGRGRAGSLFGMWALQLLVTASCLAPAPLLQLLTDATQMLRQLSSTDASTTPGA